MRKKSLFIIIPTTVLSILCFVLAINPFIVLFNSGRIYSYGVSTWKEEACIEPKEYVYWGNFEAQEGKTKWRSFYVRSDSNTPITLNITSQGWNPEEAEGFLIFGHNYDGTVMNPGEVIEISVSLYCDPNIHGIYDFSFNIILEAIRVT